MKHAIQQLHEDPNKQTTHHDMSSRIWRGGFSTNYWTTISWPMAELHLALH